MSFPQASPLRFLKASPLNFRTTRAHPYQEIRLLSQVQMHGFLSFLSPVDLSSEIYNGLFFQVTFSTGESVAATWTIHDDPAADALVTHFVPSEAAYMAALAQALLNGSTLDSSTVAPTHVEQSFTVNFTAGATTFTQLFDLDAGTNIFYWRHLAVDRLATLRAATLGVAGYSSNEAHWNRTIITQPGLSDPIFYSDGTSDVPGVPTTNPLGNFYARILQRTPSDFLGIEGGFYYPGLKLQDRRAAQDRLIFVVDGPDLNPLTNLIPDVTTTPIWMTNDVIDCGQVLHRIHQSPVFVRTDVRAIVTPFDPTTPPYFTSLHSSLTFGPDSYPSPESDTLAYPVDTYGRVQFETYCPATVSPTFWADNPEDYLVQQIYCHAPATNVSPFVIPP